MNNYDTIVSHITPPGRGGVGILRISGFNAKKVSKMVLGKVPKPRYADYSIFKDSNGNALDKGIALWFPNPHSFTGEDVLELQCHGGPIILDILLKHILTISDVRIAKPGEFSERAYLNNKIDLIQAEALSDMINASSEQAVRSALNSLQGEFSTRINSLIQDIINLRVHIEATIDFSDEEINVLSKKDIEIRLEQLIHDISSIYIRARQGNILREGIRVVITGPPNVGKSSLFNILTGRDAAIVTSVSGTTRDVLHEYINLDGIPLHLIDTAGLHNTNNEIERIGIERAWKEIKQADRMLLVIDSTITDEHDQYHIYSNFIGHESVNIPITVIRNKIDLSKEKPGFSNKYGYSLIRMSVYTRRGIDILREHLKDSIGFDNDVEREGSFLARRRHLQILKEVKNHLVKCKTNLTKIYRDHALLAEELRLSQQALNQITGNVTSDDLLKQIFSNFCIGK